MGKRKSPPSKPPAKRKKTAPAKSSLEISNAEKIQKLVDHLKLMKNRQDIMQRHTEYIEKKLKEFARLVAERFQLISRHLDNLSCNVQQVADDVKCLTPNNDLLIDEFLQNDQLTCPNSPLSMDGEMMSESELIKVVGQYAHSTP